VPELALQGARRYPTSARPQAGQTGRSSNWAGAAAALKARRPGFRLTESRKPSGIQCAILIA